MAIRDLTDKEQALLIGGYQTDDLFRVEVYAERFDSDFGYSFDLWNDPFYWDRWDDYDNPGSPDGGGNTPDCKSHDDADVERYVDQLASKLARDIIAKPNDNSAEYLGFIYRDGHGVIRSSQLFGGTGSSVSVDYKNLGFPVSQIIGIVHNHDRAHYGQTSASADANRFPSPNDWAAANKIVSKGADASTLALYLLDTNSNFRQYDYADKSRWVDSSNRLKPNAALGTSTSKTLVPSSCPR